MIGKPFDQISKVDIDNLIENKVAESRKIDYKREIAGDSGRAAKYVRSVGEREGVRMG